MGVLQQAERAQQVALAQAPAQSQQLDLSGTTLSPQLWPNRQVATLLVSYNFTTQFTNVSSNNNNIKLP